MSLVKLHRLLREPLDQVKSHHAKGDLAVGYWAICGVLFIIATAFIGYAWMPLGIAEWLEPLATAAAFGAAIVAGAYAVRAFRVESNREERFQQAQVTAQASLIAAWVGRFTPPPLAANADIRDKMQWSRGSQDGVYLRNASDLPVTNVRYRLFYGDELAGALIYGTLPPAADPIFVANSHGITELIEPTVKIIGAEYVVGIAFRDSAGINWYRAPDGTLTKDGTLPLP